MDNMRDLAQRSAPWAAIVVLVTLIGGAAQTADLTFVPGAENDLLVRKLGHAGVYATLAILIQVALRAPAIDAAESADRVDRATALQALARRWILPLAIAFIIAVGDEMLQSTAPGREGKVADLAIDFTGAVAGLVLHRTWRVERARRARPAVAV